MIAGVCWNCNKVSQVYSKATKNCDRCGKLLLKLALLEAPQADNGYTVDQVSE